MGSDTFLPVSFKEEKKKKGSLTFSPPPLRANPPSTNRRLCLSHPCLFVCLWASRPSPPARLALLGDHHYQHLKKFNPLIPTHTLTLPPLSSSAPLMCTRWLQLTGKKYSKTSSYVGTTALNPPAVSSELNSYLDPSTKKKQPLRMWNQVSNPISFKVIRTAP